jgi:hypothetical protein
MTAKKNNKAENAATTASLEIPPRNVFINPADLEFCRLPPVGQRSPETFFLSRAALNDLILPSAKNNFSPAVKSFCLRQKGAKTGIRLIDRSSLVSHIRANEEKFNPASGAKNQEGASQ